MLQKIEYQTGELPKNSLFLYWRIRDYNESICNLNFFFCRYYLRTSLCVFCFPLDYLWLCAIPRLPCLWPPSWDSLHDIGVIWFLLLMCFDMLFHLVSLFSLSSWLLGKSIHHIRTDWEKYHLLTQIAPCLFSSNTEHGFQSWLEGKSWWSHSFQGEGRCRELLERLRWEESPNRNDFRCLMFVVFKKGPSRSDERAWYLREKEDTDSTRALIIYVVKNWVHQLDI